MPEVKGRFDFIMMGSMESGKLQREARAAMKILSTRHLRARWASADDARSQPIAALSRDAAVPADIVPYHTDFDSLKNG